MGSLKYADTKFKLNIHQPCVIKVKADFKVFSLNFVYSTCWSNYLRFRIIRYESSDCYLAKIPDTNSPFPCFDFFITPLSANKPSHSNFRYFLSSSAMGSLKYADTKFKLNIHQPCVIKVKADFKVFSLNFVYSTCWSNYLRFRIIRYESSDCYLAKIPDTNSPFPCFDFFITPLSANKPSCS